MMRTWVISALLFFPTPQAAPTVDAAFERLTKVGLFALAGLALRVATSPGKKLQGHTVSSFRDGRLREVVFIGQYNGKVLRPRSTAQTESSKI
jgi:hypothetical protein